MKKSPTPSIRTNEEIHVIAQLRSRLITRIDDLYAAFVASGRDNKEYLTVGWYEHKLFLALNTLDLTFHQEIGALLVIMEYMSLQITDFKAEAAKKPKLKGK